MEWKLSYLVERKHPLILNCEYVVIYDYFDIGVLPSYLIQIQFDSLSYRLISEKPLAKGNFYSQSVANSEIDK